MIVCFECLEGRWWKERREHMISCLRHLNKSLEKITHDCISNAWKAASREDRRLAVIILRA